MKELIKKQHEECRKAYESLTDKTSAAALQLLGAMGAYENLCPELKESDSDKIRKEIIEHIKDQQSSFVSAPDCRDKSEEEENQKYNSWIAWLEAQGEQKPNKVEPKFKVGDIMRTKEEVKRDITDGLPVVVSIDNEYYHCNNELIAIKNQEDYEFPPLNSQQKPDDKANPKFHKGEWIVWQDKCYKVNYNGCGYELVDQNGLSTWLEYGTVDTSARLYDVTKDAKDGDVLADNVGVILFRKIGNEKYANVVDYYCVVDTSGKFKIQEKDFYWGETNDVLQLHPATKEQYDTLMKAMTDAGYTFDFEKKELKKIE